MGLLLALVGAEEGAPASPARMAGAGRSSKRRPRYEVELDGEVLAVSSAEEAQAVLDRAREQAKQTVEAKQEPKPVKPALPAPKVAPPELPVVRPDLGALASQLVGGIAFNFDAAYAAIEAARQEADRRAAIEADDEEVMVLLSARKMKRDRKIEDDDEEVMMILAKRTSYIASQLRSIMENRV